jgi:hypothetical protein
MDPYRASRAERSSALLKSLGDRAFWNASAARCFKQAGHFHALIRETKEMPR